MTFVNMLCTRALYCTPLKKKEKKGKRREAVNLLLFSGFLLKRLVIVHQMALRFASNRISINIYI